jgi:hypothetical protein
MRESQSNFEEALMGMSQKGIINPFRPGAGHIPPHLAGRQHEYEEFKRILKQDVVLKNLILTGLRGIGKTVLMETFKPMAIQAGWLWAGADLSESTSVTETTLATRLLTDLSVVTSSITIGERPTVGFAPRAESELPNTLTYSALATIYESIPGLVLDKLKGILEFVWPYLDGVGRKGIIFAYDEAQTLADQAAKEQYPLSVLLDLFQSLQRKNMRFMLVLTGLPTLFPKLVEARTFAERMFHVMFLDPLNEDETKDAITIPIQRNSCPFSFHADSIKVIWTVTRGYPYFIQYVCREVFDVWIQASESGQSGPKVPVGPIMRKLDSDFFAGRWARATDRQRELLSVVSQLENSDAEFTVQEIVESPPNQSLGKPFSNSHVSQMLVSLADSGLIYKNRHGKYSFAVPLLGEFIKRQNALLVPLN